MISGRSFSEFCHTVIDPRYPERRSFRYSTAIPNEWVFINGDYLQHFINQLPILVIKKFTIILHNTDRTFGLSELQKLLPFVNHIYALNCSVQHPRVSQIPLGFVDKQLPFLQGFTVPNVPRDIEIYMNFTSSTNASKRQDCVKAFEGDKRVVQKTGLTVPEYYSDLCRSKFVLCPEGTGMDTHRVYESLFCGATPVVLRNTLSPLYERLPVCIIDKWTDPFYVPEGKQPWLIQARSYLSFK
jgi:hypothetical protein